MSAMSDLDIEVQRIKAMRHEARERFIEAHCRFVEAEERMHRDRKELERLDHEYHAALYELEGGF